jgi:hypothetical protein
MTSIVLQPRRLQPDLALPAGCARWLLPADASSVADRLHTYIGGYPARIREALEETFPAIARIVGPDEFTALTERYARRGPLDSYNLNDAGAFLPEFLRVDPLSIRLEFLPDLAELEWRITRAFHARQAEPLDQATVSSWSSEELPFVVLRFQPAVAVVVSHARIRRIWMAAREAEGPIDVRRPARRTYTLVWRARFSVRCGGVTAGEACTLMALKSGRMLGQVIEALPQRIPPARVSQWFARWISMGLVTRASGPRARRRAAR